MPRNLRGGKAYKKKKKPVAGDPAEGRVERFVGPDRSQGVDYARILRALGNRRMLCFCNDGVERVCKIRGALCKGPKRKKIEVGDIVAVSYRAYVDGAADETDDSDNEEEEVAAVTTLHRTATTAAASTEMTPTATAATLDCGRKDVADIVEKYDSRNWRHIRKEGGLHPHLFGSGPAATGGGSAMVAEEDDIFESREEEAADEEEEMGDDDIDAI